MTWIGTNAAVDRPPASRCSIGKTAEAGGRHEVLLLRWLIRGAHGKGRGHVRHYGRNLADRRSRSFVTARWPGRSLSRVESEILGGILCSFCRAYFRVNRNQPSRSIHHPRQRKSEF